MGVRFISDRVDFVPGSMAAEVALDSCHSGGHHASPSLHDHFAVFFPFILVLLNFKTKNAETVAEKKINHSTAVPQPDILTMHLRFKDMLQQRP